MLMPCGMLVYRDLTSLVIRIFPSFICSRKFSTVFKKWFVSSIKEGVSFTFGFK